MLLFEKLKLPNGSIIPNRIAKAAMEESMADQQHAPSPSLIRLYQSWAHGQAGLIITGNVMVDGNAVTGPKNIILENDLHLNQFKQWAAVSKLQNAQVWMQINHPGRQMPANLGQQTWAPSAIPLNLGKMSKHFNTPSEMTEDKILDIIQRFARTATLAEQAGFDGVEVHAAHGYLLSQFLSPLSNHRADRWGGSLKNRARLLVEIILAIRQVVSAGFSVAVKLNAADFLRGGFSTTEAIEVVQILNTLPVDLVELSGGNYEAPAMQGPLQTEQQLAAEAYFLDLAQQIKTIATMPIMVTGGIRRQAVAEQVLAQGIDMVGMASALALNPHLPYDWFLGKSQVLALQPIQWKNKSLAALAYLASVQYQLNKIGMGLKVNPKVSPRTALFTQQLSNLCRNKQYKAWVNNR